MEFAILGPVEARGDGGLLALGGPKPRTVLVVLLLDRNRVVSRDRLLDALWGERAPASASHTLDDYVSRLRKVLGEERIVRRPPGYELRVEEGELDLDRFEQLRALAAEQLNAADHAAAAESLAAAIGLFRGPALADFRDEPFAREEAVRIDEHRLLALEDRIAAELELGRSAELVPELEQLVRERPYRERPLEQLMLALYRAGRQVEALDAYRSARTILASELGLEPGPALRELERAILAHEPSLEPAQVSDPAHAIVAAPGRRRTSIVLGGLAAAALAAIGGFFWLRDDRHSGGTATAGDRVVAIDAATGRVTKSVSVAQAPATIASAESAVWVGSAGSQVVSRIDASSRSTDDVQLQTQPGAIVAAGNAIWVAGTLGGSITRIDPATDRITQRLRLAGGGAASIAAGPSGLWALDTTDRALVRIDPALGRFGHHISLDFAPGALAVGRTLWVTNYGAGSVSEVDPLSGATLGSVNVGQGPVAVAIGPGGVWVANSLDGTVSRINPRTRSVVATIPVGNTPSSIVVSSGSVWVANRFSGTVARISARTNELVQSIEVGGRPTSVAAAGGSIWAGTGAAGGDHRGGTLVLATTNVFGTADPALYFFALPTQFTGLAYDTLVTFQHVDGSPGLRLVPDLAVALPVPADNGTTYTFRLRSGIRYSNGRALHARDFRRGLERLFRLESPGASHFASLVGGGACTRTPWDCNLGRGIVADDRAGTVSFHLRSPDPDFLYSLATFAFSAPIPPGVADPTHGSLVPGTGPYRVVAATPRAFRFARNPHFHEWSHAAQPDGYPDAIVWRFFPSHEAVVDAVVKGRADWTFDLIPPAQLRRLRLTVPKQVHVNPWLLFEYAPLNTHAPPFDDVRVRQALNFAIDRKKIVEMYGGPEVAAPSCQPLVPGLPGYRRYCPYTRNPRADGVWTAPDLARAKRLVGESGTRGALIDVWGTSDELAIPTPLVTYFARVLRSLGYRTRIHRAAVASLDYAQRAEFQLSVDGDWLPDYPSPSSYMPDKFGCRSSESFGYYCDPALDRQMAQAKALELSDPARSARIWTEIDHRITDQAWWVPFVLPRGVDLVSARVRNYEFHPLWGFIADQAQLR